MVGRRMFAGLAFAHMAMLLAAQSRTDDSSPPKEPDMNHDLRLATRADFEETATIRAAAFNPDRLTGAIITRADQDRWEAERAAKRAARSAKRLAIRDAQLARVQRSA